MTPLADAVRFVNGDTDQLTLRMDCTQQLTEVVRRTELWRDVK